MGPPWILRNLLHTLLPFLLQILLVTSSYPPIPVSSFPSSSVLLTACLPYHPYLPCVPFHHPWVPYLHPWVPFFHPWVPFHLSLVHWSTHGSHSTSHGSHSTSH